MKKEQTIGTVSTGQLHAETTVDTPCIDYERASSPAIKHKQDTTSRDELGRTVRTSKISGQIIVRVSTLSVHQTGITCTDI